MKTEQEKVSEMIKRRNEFSVNFCKEKGWTTIIENLTIEQIMEIRHHQGWKEIPTLIENGQ
jgi:hypothetical protein